MPGARTILALLLALSVALLPIPAAVAHVQATSMASMHDGHCCDAAKTCEKNDCGSIAGCALKCFGFYGSVPMAAGLPTFLIAANAGIAADLGLPGTVNSPPLPPPRL
jgi:hypothetical protein